MVQGAPDTDLGPLELTVSRKGSHWIVIEINTCINTYSMSVLKGNSREGECPTQKERELDRLKLNRKGQEKAFPTDPH